MFVEGVPECIAQLQHLCPVLPCPCHWQVDVVLGKWCDFAMRYVDSAQIDLKTPVWSGGLPDLNFGICESRQPNGQQIGIRSSFINLRQAACKWWFCCTDQPNPHCRLTESVSRMIPRPSQWRVFCPPTRNCLPGTMYGCSLNCHRGDGSLPLHG